MYRYAYNTRTIVLACHLEFRVLTQRLCSCADSSYWCHTQLGLTDGDFEAPGDAQNMLLKGRY
jgi:hypothetical protein